MCLKKENKSTHLHARFCQIQPHRKLFSGTQNIDYQNMC